jgi:ABC-2 type transport system ATP-binding protein
MPAAVPRTAAGAPSRHARGSASLMAIASGRRPRDELQKRFRDLTGSILPPPVVLRAVGLTKRFGRSVLALSDIDLEIARGSSTALLGPNGAGKSTLVKLWVGFQRPTAGRVEVSGFDPWRERPAALGCVAYVDQGGQLYRDLTVIEHLDLAGSLRPRFDRDLALDRLGELRISIHARAGTLSAGERAQVLLSIALGTRAEILLLDEPLASLDPLARREFLQVLRESSMSGGTTTLLASHLVSDLDQACDRLVVLGRGRKLLDTSIAAALRSHTIVAGATDGQVGRFRGRTGEDLALLNRAPGDGERAPTLEEVVLGYLAAGRGGDQLT